jgi:DNA repair photolyase
MKISGTKEWSTSSVNVIKGCAHDCLYCYAKAQAIRFGRATPESWQCEELLPLKKFGKRKGRIMFPTTHDITLENYEHCVGAIKRMLAAGNRLLIVSKPDSLVFDRLFDDVVIRHYHNATEFRFTIGSMDRRTLAFWEPGAPSFAERLYVLMRACRHGFKTSVSVEPMLDSRLEDIVRLFHTLEPYVTETIWFGRMNMAAARLRLNGHGDPETLLRADKLKMAHADGAIQRLAEMLGHPRPKLRWKESLKPALGIPLETKAGTDR